MGQEAQIRINLVLNYVSKTGEWPDTSKVEEMVKYVLSTNKIVPVHGQIIAQ